MTTHLPFHTETVTGDCFDIAFPLHPETCSPVRVNQMLRAALDAIDREVKLDPGTSNGDVLQALAMALAVRGAIIAAPKPVTDRLAQDLLRVALSALDSAQHSTPTAGHA